MKRDEKMKRPLDLIWGAQAIADELGQPRHAVYYMLENGQIVGAKKLANKWVVSRKRLLEFFEIAA